MPTTHTPYQGFAQEMTYPEYVLLSDMPYMWYSSDATKNYKNYYRKSGNNYVLIGDNTAPNFASEDFYVKFDTQPSYTNPELHRFVENAPEDIKFKFLVSGTDSYRYVETEDYYTLTTEKPDDWETNYTDYLYVEDYTVTTYQPVDWETNYTRYFEKSGDIYTPILGSTAPTWKPDTYYMYAKTCKYVSGNIAPQWSPNTYYKVSDSYTLTAVTPHDWETNYRRYFYKDGGTYVRVSGDSAPPWESNKYYVCNEIP